MQFDQLGLAGLATLVLSKSYNFYDVTTNIFAEINSEQT